jgi:acyl-coenzyme A synthetase/AMP-(fatty) acid ligase
VAPFEVEEDLLSHPDVFEAGLAVWLGEDRLIELKAVAALRQTSTASDKTAQAQQEHCRQQPALYKYPRSIEFRTDPPKTASGKIERLELRSKAWDRRVDPDGADRLGRNCK